MTDLTSAAIHLADFCASFEKDMIDNVQSRLHDFNLSKETLRQGLQGLRERLEQSAHLMESLENLCSPIARLSDDLILQILEYCMDDAYREWNWEEHLEVPAAFSLCSRWRNVAIKSPSLWSKLRLPMGSHLLGLFVERSANCRLEIKIENDDFISRPEDLQGPKGFGSFCRTFARLSPRISRLYLHWTDGDSADHELRFAVLRLMGLNELTSLEFLKITDYNNDALPAPVLNAPNLEEFNFVGYPPQIPEVSHDLVDFKCDWLELGPQDILSLLSKYPKLENFDITNGNPPVYIRRVACSMLSLPHLETLRVRSFLPTDMNELITNLHIPSWRTMRLAMFLNREKVERRPVGEWGIEEFLGRHISAFDGIIFFKEPRRRYHFYYTLTSKSGREMHMKYNASLGSSTPIASLPKLSSYPNNLSSIDFDLLELPSTHDLIRGLSSWSNVTCIRVRTEKSEFARLLSVLEQEPDIICPLLEVLDCNGTIFKNARLEKFLKFRIRCGVPLHQLRVGRGALDPSAKQKFQALVGEIHEVQRLPQPSYRDMEAWEEELREI